MLIIDTNVLSCVFDPKNARHGQYREVLSFITRNRGVLAAGGTKYLKELGAIPAILKLFNQLRSSGQVRVFSAYDVDLEERRVAALAPPPGCDDQHIIALVCVSKARVVASDDRRADRYLRDRKLYSSGVRRPSIYRSARHRRLLARLPRMK